MGKVVPKLSEGNQSASGCSASPGGPQPLGQEVMGSTAGQQGWHIPGDNPTEHPGLSRAAPAPLCLCCALWGSPGPAHPESVAA